MIKNYREYLNESADTELTQEQKDFLNKYAGRGTIGTWHLNPKTGLVDVKGDFNCSSQGLNSFKGVRFGHVSGDFECWGNYLTSLEGAPQSVRGYFSSENNKLTSLEGAPQSVGGSFRCFRNNLTSLEGAPQSVGGAFLCYSNNLTSLKGFPLEIKGDIDLDPNPIWKEIEPMVRGMSDEEEKFFFKFVASSENTDKESLERIARSIERMRMI